MRRGLASLLLAAPLLALASCGGSHAAPAVVAPPAPASLPRAVAPRSYAALDSGPVRLNIFVATTRNATQSDRPGDRYGPDDVDRLQFAAVGVNVPSYRARGIGDLPRPNTIRSNSFTYAPDPTKDFFVSSVIPVDSNRFVQRVSDDLAQTRSRDVMIFVHGFNNSFEDAVLRAAQIAADINFDGTVVVFDWPSAASVSSYVRDQQTAQSSGYHLLHFLQGALHAAMPDRVDLLGHSMGSAVIAKALSLVSAADSLPRFNQVVFAAPDVDARVFRREILPALSGRSTRITLYASTDDDALRASRSLNGVWRLGLGGDSLTVVRGMDTIDASRVRADVLGHTLFGNQAFLADLAVLFADGKSPAERRLLAVNRGELVFWRFRGDSR
jgi:esterase/lipase superfamily enzyme